MRKAAADIPDRSRHECRLYVRPCFRHIGAVVKRMIFTGFSVQIVLGLAWAACNFFRVQDFLWRNFQRAEPEGAIYGLYSFVGQWPPALYLIQLGLAFYAGYRFLDRNVAGSFLMDARRRRAFSLWGSLALLTFPFALQCHLAILPYSIMSSLFLLMLSFLLEALAPPERQRRKYALRKLAVAAACGALGLLLALEAGADERDAIWGRGLRAAAAGRMAWPSLWNDRIYWPEELRGLISDDELWEITYRPGNMEAALEIIAERAGEEAAGKWYMQLAETAWQNRRPVILRQMGWDFLGYTVTPLIFPLQMEGRSYDSYSGRNYAAMREHAPLLTGRYVEYSCWWFKWVLALGAVSSVIRLLEGRMNWRRAAAAGGICVFAGAACAFLYTMRGAGLMDYRCTVAVCQLWLIWGLVGMGDNGTEEV